MTPSAFLPLFTVACILIAGPWWLISNAVGRRRQRQAEAAAATAAANIDHDARADFLVDALGPLTYQELGYMLPLTAKVWSQQGVLGWSDIVNQAAVARRIAREHPDGFDARPDARPETATAT